MLTQSAIPERFWHVAYNAARYPGAPGISGLEGGANCQLFAFELLRSFARDLPPLRSSNLWADADYTAVVSAEFEPLDLVLFNRTHDPYAAHVAVSLGGDQAIHLSRRVGTPVIWSIDRFLDEADYAVLIGAKRVIGRPAQ